WGRQIAQGVDEAHKLRVIHRDLKPENIAIVQGDVAKVFDFGIAKYRDWGVKATQAGMALGTVAYMSPEQITGSGQIEPACDVYALGLILYELFAGRHALLDPGEKLELRPMLMKVLTAEPALLHETIPDFPEDLSRIIEKMLQKDPAARFASMAELGDGLSIVLQRSMDEKRAAFLTPSNSPPVDGTPPGSIPPVSSAGTPMQPGQLTTGSTPTLRKKAKQAAALPDATSDTVAVATPSSPPAVIAESNHSIYGASVQDFDAPTGSLPGDEHAPQAGPGWTPAASQPPSHQAPYSQPPSHQAPHNPASSQQPAYNQPPSHQPQSQQPAYNQPPSHQPPSQQPAYNQAQYDPRYAHVPSHHPHGGLDTPLATSGAASSQQGGTRGFPLVAVMLIGLAGIAAGAGVVMFGLPGGDEAANAESQEATESQEAAETPAKSEAKRDDPDTTVAKSPAAPETTSSASAPPPSDSAAPAETEDAPAEPSAAAKPQPPTLQTPPRRPAVTAPKKPKAPPAAKKPAPPRSSPTKCKNGLPFCDKDGL
ncbi:MAG: protein kinase, partial [Polyangiaceae bacterium]